MDRIKIYFVDFAKGLDPHNNWFSNFLSRFFDIEICEDPDFLIYSSFGHKHLTYNCTKIFWTGENDRPNFFLSDYALTFDFNRKSNHLRLPFYVLFRTLNPTELLMPQFEEIISKNPKSKFCCFLVSNGNSPFRIEFFKKLNRVKHVDSGGKLLNNIGYQVKNKLEFISPYKFMIAYENASYPGYVTEKIYECFFTNTIPIYWGNTLIFKDFNPKRIICRHDFDSDESMIDFILYLDSNENAYQKFIEQPIFPQNQVTEYFDENRLFLFFDQIFKGNKKSKSTGLRKFIGKVIRKKRNFSQKIWRTDFR